MGGVEYVRCACVVGCMYCFKMNKKAFFTAKRNSLLGNIDEVLRFTETGVMLTFSNDKSWGIISFCCAPVSVNSRLGVGV